MRRADVHRLARLMPPFLDRRSALLWSREVVLSPNVVFLDTETTGVKPTDDVVDIAVVSNAGEIVFEHLVKPSKPIPSDTAAFIGVSNKMVANAPDLEEIYPALAEALAGRVVVAYNAEFDRAMLSSALARRGLPWLESTRWSCAMEAYAAFNGESSWHRPGFRWMSLEKATARLGIPKPTHRARADAEACRAVVQALARVSLEP